MKNLILSLVVLSFTSPLWAKCKPFITDYTVRDPIDGQAWDVTSKNYFPPTTKGEKAFPTVFVLPSIVGESPIERSVARRLCNRNINAIILDIVKDATFEEQVRNIAFEDQLLVRALSSFKYILNETKKLSNVSGKFGILGISQGAIATAFISGSVPDLSSTVIIVGAGNVRSVLTKSDQKKIAALRSARMEYYKLDTEEQYQALLATRTPHDPISVAQNIKPDSTYFFMGMKDSTVPTQYQRELYKKIKGAKVYEMRSNHIGTILKTVVLHCRIIFNFYADMFADVLEDDLKNDSDVEVVTEVH